MPGFFWQTVTPAMRQVMSSFSRTDIGRSFYLAGGTALALQLGHRRSVDLDYFSPTEDIPSIKGPLLQSLASFEPILADSEWGNLVYVARGIRMGFYGYGYELVELLIEIDGIKLASVADIALMKLDALLARAARKDFYDLYTICQGRPLRELLRLAPKKYPGVRDFETQAVKRLVYFELAEQDEPPDMLERLEWETVKTFFRRQAADIGGEWLK